MTRYRVHPGQLLRTVDALRDAAAGIEAELERLDAEVRRLEGRWSGEAREAYSRAQAQWRSDLAALNAVLDGAARRSASVSARYTQARRTVAGRWGAA
ncbi:WXG100 family type VII secretion target [Cellulomonas sp. NPDC057328]|uniref:WXG100 family type VII secretion target n=1 Tax=Cellulomonas sp. NPDC057328 TaxID=3346101 RepID=UPI00363D8DBD